jgi:hypothetical protein
MQTGTPTNTRSPSANTRSPSAAPAVNPIGAATPEEFARRLHALVRSRRLTVDSVARRSREAGTPISRATAYNLVSGSGTPRRDTIVSFLRGCGVPPREQIRWLITFDRAYPDPTRGTAPQTHPLRRAA